MITLKDYLTASNSYPDREKHAELTDEFKANASTLLEKVSGLLKELNIDKITISSGFRPTSVNSNIANSAKKSLHTRCMAIDIVDDKKQSLANKILTRPDLLIKYGLWLEDPAATKGKNSNWVHLDMGTRSARPLRMFKV